MKLLILGSAGQIGMALKAYCDDNAIDTIEFDITRTNDEDLRITDNPLLYQRAAEADLVVFLAYDVGGARYLSSKQKQFSFISNNALIMENTFQVLSRTRKPFIFVSSQMAGISYSPYGALKSVGEHYARSLGGVVVRLWNVYGVESDKEKSHVITDFLQMAHKLKSIAMMTDGTESRQFLHVEDCSRSLVTLAEQYNNIPRNKELHIASGKWNTILEVAEIISNLFPGTLINPSKTKDSVQSNSRIAPDPYIEEYWKPEISLYDGIKRVAKEMKLL